MQLTQHFLNYRPRSKTIYFDDPVDFDSEQNYNKNCTALGNTWEYYNKKISYVFNEWGFRTKTFDGVDWKNSVVVFGCSNTFGTGLAEEDTVTVQLEKLLNMPVINLGISGSAVDLAAINSLILYKHYPRPKAVVHLWTDGERYSDFNNFKTKNVRHFNIHNPNFYPNLNWGERSKFYILADRELWNNCIPYYEATWFAHFKETYDIDFLETLDKARDLRHPGSISARTAAKKIAVGLKAKGL
jgi:hypothetical protein